MYIHKNACIRAIGRLELIYFKITGFLVRRPRMPELFIALVMTSFFARDTYTGRKEGGHIPGLTNMINSMI